MEFDELKSRIQQNDNRCTALPYLLLLQEKRKYIAHPEYAHDAETIYVEHLTGDYHRESSEEAMKAWGRSYYGEDHEELELDKDYEKFQEGYYWHTVNVFLTDKGYEEHMELNRHNIGEHRTFGIHAFRNPEFDSIYKKILESERGQ